MRYLCIALLIFTKPLIANTAAASAPFLEHDSITQESGLPVLSTNSEDQGDGCEDDMDLFNNALDELDKKISDDELQEALQLQKNKQPSSALILVRKVGIGVLLGLLALKETVEQRIDACKEYWWPHPSNSNDRQSAP